MKPGRDFKKRRRYILSQGGNDILAIRNRHGVRIIRFSRFLFLIWQLVILYAEEHKGNLFIFFPQDMKESESSLSSLRHLALYWRALFPFSAARLLCTRRQPYFLSFFLSMLWICYALVTSYPPPLLPPTSSSAETPIPHIFGSREETIGA